ncbi:hypothetical protein MAPG_01158 [Magnaporthiopsis poae ATCC 64411]|uniref:Uncharacterized protein n=1 Tax=Magnaporthiopsis poae (strain ATCC 64411 / 73-15) TaxID=644358 RepID=A0A0C4DMZ0_MAGP6|nr:hypothetical protein MAPG_01158 [Magnaporthiopsis poae ATCC 64411]
MFTALTPRESETDKSPSSSPRSSLPPRLPSAMLDFSQISPSTLAPSYAVSAITSRDRGGSIKAIQSPIAAAIDSRLALPDQRDMGRNKLSMDRLEDSSQKRSSSMRSSSSFSSDTSFHSAEYRLPPCPMSRSYEAIDLSEGIDGGPVTSLSPPPPARPPNSRDTAQDSAKDNNAGKDLDATSEWALIKSRVESRSAAKPKPHVDDGLLAAAALAWWEASGTRSSPERRRRYSQLGERKRVESTLGVPAAAVIAATWRRDSARLSGLVAAAAFNSGFGLTFPSSSQMQTPEALPGGPKLALTYGPAHSSAGSSSRRSMSSGNRTTVTSGGARRAPEHLPDRHHEAARASRAQRRLSKHRYQYPNFYTTKVARKLRGEELADRRQRHSRQRLQGDSSSKAQQSTPKESRASDYVLQLSHHDKGFNFGFEL